MWANPDHDNRVKKLENGKKTVAFHTIIVYDVIRAIINDRFRYVHGFEYFEKWIFYVHSSCEWCEWKWILLLEKMWDFKMEGTEVLFKVIIK